MARFLISQQKYLELLEAQKVTAALHVLRNELAPLNTDIDKLNSLSRCACIHSVRCLTTHSQSKTVLSCARARTT